MQTLTTYRLRSDKTVALNETMKAPCLVLLHAKRIPPHVGMAIGNVYQSLTIKGHELNVPVDVLLRNISRKNIQAVFLKIRKHPTFSNEYLREHFISDIKQFEKVSEAKVTCLHPVKLFFEEAYAVDMQKVNYVFDLIEVLKEHDLIQEILFKNIHSEEVELPVYTAEDIDKGIREALAEAHKIKNSIKGEIKK